jgi:protein-tyrosine phosphatase
MRPKIHWIDLPAGVRLAIIARPRAGDWLDDEIAGWRAEGIGVVVSLLEAGEVEELGLDREPGLCHDLDMEFISFPFPDRGVPMSTREAMALAEAIVARLNEGKAVAVHCRAGIGRSSLISACVLVL